MNYYDNIIIGAGIAGLYMAYKITLGKQNCPNETFIILERNEKTMIGGRISIRKFHGTNVLGGAGIGRFNKDYLLKKLLDEFNLPYNKFEINTQFSNNIKNHVDVMKTFKMLKKEYDKHDNHLTFKEFALTKLNNKEYKDFRIATAYSDYENEDIEQTLNYYGMDDNTNELVGMSVPWKDLINKLIEKINMKNIKCNVVVNKIIKNDEKETLSFFEKKDKIIFGKQRFTNETTYKILTNKKEYNCKKIYIATDIDTIKQLLNKDKIYNEIKGQPFLRVYAKFSGNSVKIMNEYVKKTTIVSTSLYRIIKITNDIFMVGYSDNKGAKDTMKVINKDMQNKDNKYINLTKLLKKSLGIDENLDLKIDENLDLKIDDITIFYWKNGTHYYKPLNRTLYKTRNEFIKKIQNPHKNIYVIGEVVSMNQGWTEGALESVNKILIK